MLIYLFFVYPLLKEHWIRCIEDVKGEYDDILGSGIKTNTTYPHQHPINSSYDDNIVYIGFFSTLLGERERYIPK